MYLISILEDLLNVTSTLLFAIPIIIVIIIQEEFVTHHYNHFKIS